MKKYEYVLYNNYDFSENYASAREWLFATRQDDFDWETEDDVPEKMILDEMSFLEESEWTYFKSKCEELLSNGDCLLTGTCSRWTGPARGGKFIRNFQDFISCIEHLDYSITVRFLKLPVGGRQMTTATIRTPRLSTLRSFTNSPNINTPLMICIKA